MNFSYFSPQTLTEEDFLAGFVARHDVFDYLLRQLRLTDPQQAASHHLIVAPRGFGKTSLLRRIAVAVRTEDDLKSRLIALSFREEQHNVISLDIFWRNCLQSLLEIREDEQALSDELATLELAWDRNKPRQSLNAVAQDGELAKQEFNAYCARLGRRPVLLIDNLDSLLAGLPENHQWSLRNDLQAPGGPVLIAAASRYPDSTHDQKAAFYDFFRIQTLDKLSDNEVMHCLRVRAQQRGEAGKTVLDLINQNPGRIASLNTLAGGNPRTLAVLYSVLESNASADVMMQLSSMLDTFTGWYQARTDELPIQSRAVFDALALNWDPITAAALGEVTGLDTTVVSSHLARLEKNGYAETVSLSLSKKGRNGYQVSERFFNIWYLMRNGPRRTLQSIRFLTVFLQSCFSPRERQKIAHSILQDSYANPSYTLALASSLREGELKFRLLDHASDRSAMVGQFEEFEPAINLLRQETVRSRFKLKGGQESPSIAHKHSGEDINSVRGRLLESSALRASAELAVSLVNKGFGLGQLGKFKEEIGVYNEVVERFGEAKQIALREQVARALVNKGITLGQLGKSEDAISAYGEVVERFGEAKQIALREQVARALVNKGITLGQLGKSEDEIGVYGDVVARFGESQEVVLLEQVANTLSRLGNLFLDVQGDLAKAQLAFQRGLALDLSADRKKLLNANYAYVLALHSGNVPEALIHIDQVLENPENIAPSGRDFLHGLSSLAEPEATRWQSIFGHILAAIQREDEALMTNYLDDLQRLLWYLIVSGKGADFLKAMVLRSVHTKFAPLYHAVSAAIEGEEYMLKVNPETRQAAMHIYGGLARRLRLYPTSPS